MRKLVWNIKEDYIHDEVVKTGLYIDPSDVSQRVDLHDAQCLLFPNIPVVEIKKLNGLIGSAEKDEITLLETTFEDSRQEGEFHRTYQFEQFPQQFYSDLSELGWDFVLEKIQGNEFESEEKFRGYEDLTDFLREKGYDAKYDADEFPVISETVCFDFREQKFFNLSDCEGMDTFGYWDGSNWQTKSKDDSLYSYEVDLSKNSICLDEWDGSNWHSGERFAHDYIRKVLAVDGGKPDENQTYLLIYTSQYQGSLDRARFVNGKELTAHASALNEIDDGGRDMGEYLEKIHHERKE